MSMFHKVTFTVFPEPNEGFLGASKLQEVKELKDFLCSVALPCAFKASRKVILQPLNCTYEKC